MDADLAVAAVALGLVTLRAATGAADGASGALAVVVAGVGAVALWRVQQDRRDRASDVDRRLRLLEESGRDAGMRHETRARMGARAGPDPELYTLRNVTPSTARPLRRLARRPHVARALVRLRAMLRTDQGGLWRASVALEDFFARVDALLDPPAPAALPARNAAATVQTLLDTRSEAMNALASLESARPTPAHRARVRTAIAVVRDATAAAMQAVMDAYPGSPELQAVDWRAPRGHDPARDARYHVHV